MAQRIAFQVHFTTGLLNPVQILITQKAPAAALGSSIPPYPASLMPPTPRTLFFASLSTPAARSISTTAAQPLLAAKCSGVNPFCGARTALRQDAPLRASAHAPSRNRDPLNYISRRAHPRKRAHIWTHTGLRANLFWFALTSNVDTTPQTEFMVFWYKNSSTSGRMTNSNSPFPNDVYF